MKNNNTKINFESESFRRYLGNTSWLFGEKVVRLIVTFFVGILIVRYLGPSNFGLLSYAISFAGLFSTLATLGLDTIITRELVKEPEKRDVILGSVFTIRLIGSFLSFVFIGIAVILTSENPYTVLLIAIIALSTIFQSFNVIDYYFQSRVQAKYSVIVLFTSLMIGSLIKVVLIILSAALIWFAVVTTLEIVFLAIGYLIVYKINDLKITNWKYQKNLALNMLKDSWPLILSGLAIAVYMKIGQVIIKNLLSNQELGYYAAAVRLSEAWYFVPMAITNSLFPAIVNAKQVSEELYLSRMQKLYDIMAWIAISIALPVTLFSELIVKILLGVEYLSAAPVLTIYIWAAVPTFLGVASSQYLIAENLTRVSFYRTLIGMIVNVILNIILIPLFGIVGSAYATLISSVFATFSIATNKKTFSQIPLMLKSIIFIDLFKFITNYVFNKHSKN
ncbi:MAG TPA: flippase [Ignavibacteriaceae bacterium]|nr:flippase [Ignavibacteriaceae bacterium]HOJ16969.1 flippase [Ignavibacteriaceae bacterium]